LILEKRCDTEIILVKINQENIDEAIINGYISEKPNIKLPFEDNN
jgi:hypothetical protein